MLAKGIMISALVAIVALMVLLQLTTPTTIGPLGILIVFILMYITALGVLTFLILGSSYAAAKASRLMAMRTPIHPMSLGRAYYFASVVALAPIMLIGIQSVATVGVYDVLLVAAFVGIACLYISKRT